MQQKYIPSLEDFPVAPVKRRFLFCNQMFFCPLLKIYVKVNLTPEGHPVIKAVAFSLRRFKSSQFKNSRYRLSGAPLTVHIFAPFLLSIIFFFIDI